MSQNLSEQEIIRREKLKALEAAGIQAYPAPLYPVTHYSSDIKSAFTEENKETAWVQNFINGSQGNSSKQSTLAVRAVRTF